MEFLFFCCARPVRPCSSPLFQRSVALGDIEVTSVCVALAALGSFTQNTTLPRTTLSHTTLLQTTLPRTHTHTLRNTHTRARTRLCRTQLPPHTNCHAQLCHTHTQLVHTICFPPCPHHVTMSFRCPAFPISCSHRFGRCWKKLTCWTIRFLNVLAMVPRKTVADVSKIQNYRRGEWFWCMDIRANPLMDRKVVGCCALLEWLQRWLWCSCRKM